MFIRKPINIIMTSLKIKCLNLIENLKKNDCDKKLVKQYDLPENIKYYIYKFLDVLKINKI